MSLRDCRERTDFDITEVARIIGVDRRTYYLWESQGKDIPSSMLIKLARLFDCTLNDLLDYSTYESTYKMDILGLIKNTRKAKRMHQDEIAKKIGIAKETYRDIENGKIRLKLDDYIKICEVLELSPAIIANDDNSINLKLSRDDYIAIRNAIDVLNKINQQGYYTITDNSGDITIRSNINIIKK